MALVGSSIYANVSSTFTSLTVDATSSINASGKGCIGGRIGSGLAGYGPDLTTGICTVATSGYGKNNFGGAAHAGTGGANSGWPGTAQTTTYGSSTFPILFGSGGGKGNEADGGNGGGRLQLVITDTLTIDGSIKANGDVGQAVGNGAGGGAGGSIYINAAALSGSGSILTSGGNGSVHGGGGGGGRAAVYYGSLGSFSLSNVLSSAGAGAGAGTAGTDGTVYTFQTNVAPDFPVSLGPTALINGSTTSTATPTFSFTLSDPDVADTTKYQIQIDDSSDFLSAVVDYTSALAAQGTRTFQVGQAAGSGSYASGEGVTLSSGSYYWRVKTIDSNAAASSYETANAGAIAFVVDTTPRYLSFESTTGSGLESITATSVRIVLNTTHFESVTTTYSVIVASTTAAGTGTDYTLSTGTATIAAGQTSTTISLVIVDDDIDESSEVIGIELSSPINAIIGSNTSTLYTILDNDTAGVTITESGGSTSVTEGGTTDSFTVVLTSQPTSTVQVLFATSTAGVTLSAASVSFDSSDWSTPQTVTVTATDDLIAEGSHTTTIVPTITSTAYGYSSLVPVSIDVLVTDNDSAGVSISKDSASITEGGSTGSYTVVLTTAPTSTVEILLSLSNARLNPDISLLSFTTTTWDVPQTIVVSAVNDELFQSDQTGTISHTASSTGLGYTTSLVITSVQVTIRDIDNPGGGAAGSAAGGGAGGGTIQTIFSLVPANTPAPIVVAPITPPPLIVVAPIQDIVAPIAPAPRPLPGQQVVTILNPKDVRSLVEATNGSRDFSSEAKNARLVTQDAREFKVPLTDEQSLVLANFVTYGISEQTRVLGSGERRALVRDALQTMKTGKISPTDLERLARGLKPTYRNKAAEIAQLPRVRQTFETIYGHVPNFKDPSEDLAWNALMYRIRFPRDLKQEVEGIKEFKKLFNRNPSDPFQWAVVRVLGYVKPS